MGTQMWEYLQRLRGAVRGFRYLGFRWFLPCVGYLMHPILRRFFKGRWIQLSGYRAEIGTSDVFVLGQLFREYPPDQVRRSLLDCDLVLDAGANVGAFCWLVRQFTPDVPIVALEPNARNFQCLMSQDFLRNVTPINAAIGSEAGVARLVTGESAAGHFIDENGTAGVEVEVRGLSNLCQNATNIFLKIDIEGGEKRLLENGVPPSIRSIVMEWHFAEGPEKLLPQGVWSHHGGNSYSWVRVES